MNWLSRLTPSSGSIGRRAHNAQMMHDEMVPVLPNGLPVSERPLTRPSGALSPDGGEGVNSNIFFSLAPSGESRCGCDAMHNLGNWNR